MPLGVGAQLLRRNVCDLPDTLADVALGIAVVVIDVLTQRRMYSLEGLLSLQTAGRTADVINVTVLAIAGLRQIFGKLPILEVVTGGLAEGKCLAFVLRTATGATLVVLRRI